MENRFGFKDFLVVVLLLALIVSVWLAMKQYDRQYDIVRSIDDKLDTQTRDLAEIHRALAGGVVPSTQAGPTTQAVQTATDSSFGDPFNRMRLARVKPDFAEGGWLIDAFGGGVAKLTPLLSGDVSASVVQDSVLEGLVTRDPETLEWQGLIAKSWQINDTSKAYFDYVAQKKKAGVKDEDIAKDPHLPVPLTITFQMRDGVVFSDGKPMTADDVVFSFNFVMDEKIAAPRQRAYYEKIARVEKVGPLEVKFIFKEPYFEAFELAGTIAVMPQHFYKQFTPEEFNQSVGYLMGSGPYKMPDPKSWKPGELIQLIRNDRYWGARPAFDKLVYKEISNDVARLTAFRNGEVDEFGAAPEQYKEMLNDKALVARTRHFEYSTPLGGYRFVAWNQARNGKPTFFADKRVRQAMTMLVDRQRLIQEVMLGYAVEATGPFNPSSKQTNPEVKPWAYDVERAKIQLAEAGYKDRNGDGVIESESGEPFKFKLTYPSGSSNYESMALFMKDAYARAGVVLEPDPLEWSVFTDRLNNKNFEAISLGWSAGIETDVYQMFHSSQMVEGGDDFISYKNPQVDALIEQARTTVDETARMALWRKVHAIMHEDQPYTFLFFPMSLRFIDQRIHNVEKIKLGLNPHEEWFVPKPLQREGQ